MSAPTAEAQLPAVALEKTAIEITAIDLEKKTITGKDRFDTVFVFSYASSTTLRGIDPSALSVTLGTFAAGGRPMPLRVGQDVQIRWRPDTVRKSRSAVEIITLE